MKCLKCGVENVDGVRFCASCGEPMVALNTEVPVYANEPVNFKSFLKMYGPKGTNGLVITLAVFCFLNTAICAAAAAINVINLVLAIVYGICGVLMLVRKKSIFPLIAGIAGAIVMVINMSMGGNPAAGILVPIFGFGAFASLRKAEKGYAAYLNTGILPQERMK